MNEYLEQSAIDYFKAEVAKIRAIFENAMKEASEMRKQYATKKEANHVNENKHLERVYEIQENVMALELTRRLYEQAFIMTISEEEIRNVTKNYTTDLNTLKEKIYLAICPVVQSKFYFPGYGEHQFKEYQQELTSYSEIFNNENKLITAQLVNLITYDYNLAMQLKPLVIEYQNTLYSKKDQEWDLFAAKVSQIFNADLSTAVVFELFSGLHLYGVEQLPAAYGKYEQYFQAKTFLEMQKFARSRALANKQQTYNYDNDNEPKKR